MTSKNLIRVTVLVIVCSLSPHLSPAQAPSRIAIIDIQQAIANSEEGKKESSVLNAKATAKRAELEKLQKDIESMQKQLQDQATTLNDDAKAQLARQIDQKGKDLQRQQQDAQDEFQGLSQEIVSRIGRKMLKVIEQFASEQGYTAVLDVSSPQSGVLWYTPTSNITTEIIRRFDAGSTKPAAPAAKPTPTPPPPKN
ncbi:MAG: OmpH family outer membrane protein [Acidobacteriia bacterium]|nr:OmpH family outer membrane protein [Terriglobia bacterium]